MLFTWKDVFEKNLLRIKQTDLIEHAIILTSNVQPIRARIPLYSKEKIAFCQRLLPKMEDAGLTFRYDSAWRARTKFVLKPRWEEPPRENSLRMVQNCIPLNRVTEKSRYPCPHQQKFILRLRRGRHVRTHPTSLFRPLRPGRPDPIFKRRLRPDVTSDLNDVPLRPHTSCSSPAAHLTS